MGRIIRPDGISTKAEKIDMKQAHMTHKVIMIYLKHNFSDQLELCKCVGCGDIRERLGGDSSLV